MTGTYRPLPIGNSFFEEVIEREYYYVDKTLFIKELLDKAAKVTLCTRPRRFGKTLTQTMLKCFFENRSQFDGKDTRKLFNGLKIESAGKQYIEHQGKYPVVFLSFKEAKRNNFEGSYKGLIDELTGEFNRHYYAREKISNDTHKALFEKLASGKASRDEYSNSLKFLCKCLNDYYGQKTVVLIDEYDVPLENSWFRGFYDEMVNFIRPLLSSAFKDNPDLQFTVMTGCLRISKESIFTGLNNLQVVSILSEHYDEFFGFTQDEMDAMLGFYGLTAKRQIIRDWYDGYLFGNTEVYNPWSSLNVIINWLKNINRYPEPHWANTSGNDIVRELVTRANRETRAELETLMSGGTISKLIHEDITYDEIYKEPDNLWNFLFFTGYLKKVGESVDHKERIILEMKIPNKELEIIYITKIQEWFKERISEKNLDTFFTAILNGDTETIQSELNALLMESISFMDSAENFYHGFMAGILSRQEEYSIKSNRESGKGRSDIVMHCVSRTGKAIIFELKVAKRFHDLTGVCEEALKQIEDNNYTAYWQEEGYSDIIKYGVGFYRKDCKVLKR